MARGEFGRRETPGFLRELSVAPFTAGAAGAAGAVTTAAFCAVLRLDLRTPTGSSEASGCLCKPSAAAPFLLLDAFVVLLVSRLQLRVVGGEESRS